MIATEPVRARYSSALPLKLDASLFLEIANQNIGEIYRHSVFYETLLQGGRNLLLDNRLDFSTFLLKAMRI